MPPIFRTAGLAVCLVATASLSAQSPAEEFQHICRDLSESENQYFGLGFAREIEKRYNESTDPLEKIGFQGLWGRELLKHGRLEEAVAQLTDALAKARSQNREDQLVTAIHWQLALAHLSLAEDQNCVGHRTGASCILPIGKDGVHPLPEHSRKASALFLDYVKQHPKNIQAVWLLNLASRVSGDYPEGVPQDLRVPDANLQAAPGSRASPERWSDIAVPLGVNATDLAGGAAVDDFDGDGFLDLITTTWDPCGSMKAFRSDGSGGYDDVSTEWGLSEQLGGLNLIHGDYDNDGRLDLFVLRGAWLLAEGQIRNSLLRNVATDGGLRFEDRTRRAGLAEPAYPTQTAAFADYDGDGDLDLYVGNEATGRNPFPSQLFQNNGDGTFSDRAVSAQVTNLRYAKGVTWGDYDNDGDPDLYVSNFGENRLYRNDGAASGVGRFVDVAPELGLTRPERESFASWFFDYDNDGDLDLFVGDYVLKTPEVTGSYMGMKTERGQPLLYKNLLVESGEARIVTFEEVSRSVGIRRPAMPMGANYGDLDNDGWLDIYLGTGEPDLASLMPNQMYQNLGGSFEEVTFPGGFGHLQKGHGVAFGDLDNDGDQDLFHQLGGFYPGDTFGNALFENPGSDHRWLSLELRGTRANGFGVGARIEVVVREESAPRSIHLLAGSGGSFGSSTLRQEIGLGDAQSLERIEVLWPGSGTHQVLGPESLVGVELNGFFRLTEGDPRLVRLERTEIELGKNVPSRPHP